MAIITTKKGQEILVDSDKLELLNEYTWYVVNGYARSGAYAWTIPSMRPKNRPKHKSQFMHRLLTNCPEGMVVDHINGNKLDNRLENLEIVTASENTKRAHKNGLIKYKYKYFTVK